MPKPCPGANCCDSDTGPCGCSNTLTLTISNAQAVWQQYILRIFGEECTTMDFTGIDAIEGTYEIILNEAVSDYEIVRVAATNNYQTEYASNYCLFVQIYAIYLPSTACEIAFYMRWKFENLGSGTTCMDLEDVDFDTGSQAWAFTNDNFAAYLPVCESDTGTLTAPVAGDINGECDTEYYTFDWSITYV